MPIHTLFWGVFGAKMGEIETFCIFIPLGMQLTQKHAFSVITCQNRSSGLTLSSAKETIKNKLKTQTLNISHFTPLVRLTCHLGCRVVC